MEALRGASYGLSNAEIGRRMFVSEDTVKSHMRAVMRKLRARDRTHATRIGLELGLLPLPSQAPPRPEWTEPNGALGVMAGWEPAGITITGCLHPAGPQVAMDFGAYQIRWPAHVARAVFAAGLAACQYAQDMAVPDPEVSDV